MSRELEIWINEKKHLFPPTNESLISLLRRIGYTGTKLGCSEGGCGSCTVLVSYFCYSTRTIKHISVNSCLQPASALHKKHVVTVEGLRGPVQGVLAKSHSSQCGFCTPGIVMSLYAQLKNQPFSTAHEIEDAFDGNLCRCTGYRPILDGAKQFAHCGNDCNTCPTKDTCIEKDIEDTVSKKTIINPLVQEFQDNDISFPSELLSYHEQRNCAEFYVFEKQGYRWAHPSTKQELLHLMQEFPGAKIINGNTEVGIEMRFKNQKYPVFIHTSDVNELKQISIQNQDLWIGGLTTITDLQIQLQNYVKTMPEPQTRGMVAILDNIKYFAGRQIRNVSAIGGNICTASPISDLNPVLLGLGAELILESTVERRIVPISSFFQSYRKTELKQNEVLTLIKIPLTSEYVFTSAFKQAKRRDDDIAIVNAGFMVQLKPQDTEFFIEKASLAYGGMGPISALALKTNEFLNGKKWSLYTIEHCYSIILQDFPLSATSPGGQIEYRKTLAQSFLFKFYLRTQDCLGKMNALLNLDSRCLSALKEIHRPLSSGKQIFSESDGKGIVGKSVMHASAMQQVKGEAVYVDDIPKYHNELYACIVASTQAHAILENVDPSEALSYPGVVDYISRKDVPESDHHGDPNMIGPVFRDEELFATNEVHFVGQMIGMIVAESEEQARAAAKLVKVSYKPLPAIFTTEEAIEKESFFPAERIINSGSFKEGEPVLCPLSTASHHVEGTARISAQEHFYLETMASLVVPSKEHDEIEVFASTQNPKETQDFVAHVLGIPFNRVVCRVKRLGGGFGGKESRSMFLSCGLAVAAKKLMRPVRCMLTREEDMVMSGTRHPFLGQYKVGFTDQGKLVSLELKMYANAGYSHDLSIAVMERSLTHCDNAYKIPNMKLYGRLCKTNTATNTAFRGFGGPQGMMVAEQYITHIADYLGKPVEEIRRLNLYENGDKTHFDMPLESVYLGRAWEELEKSSDFQARRVAVSDFNKKNKYRKRGLTLMPTKFGLAFTARFLNQAGALVHVYTDGSVRITHGGTEMGQVLQIAADAFDIPLSKVFLSETRTDTVPNTSATAASVSSDINGMAVLNACEQINDRIKPLREANPNKSWEEIVKMAYFERINLSANGFYKTPDLTFDWNTLKGRMFSYFTYGAACTEVEIDTLTGDHVVLSSHIIMDIGRPINPAIDVGQIEGAFTQGLGWSTIEEPLVSPSTGFLFTRGPGLYKIPSFKDIPADFRVTVMDGVRNTRAIHSSKAVGEPPLFLGASCFFAIQDAIKSFRLDAGLKGPFRLDSPATSERIRLSCADDFVNRAKTPLKQGEKPWAVAV